MNGVIFDDKHSYRDWALVLRNRPKVSPPTPKQKLITVPGSDRIIDLTQLLTGNVHYEPRTITMEFTMAADRERWADLYSDILDALHGKSIKIVMDNDPNWYYTGRVIVGDLEAEKSTANLTMTAMVEPYKRERYGEGRRL